MTEFGIFHHHFDRAGSRSRIETNRRSQGILTNRGNSLTCWLCSIKASTAAGDSAWKRLDRVVPDRGPAWSAPS